MRSPNLMMRASVKNAIQWLLDGQLLFGDRRCLRVKLMLRADKVSGAQEF